VTVLISETIQALRLVEPLVERTLHEPSGTTFGLSVCGYDVRLDEDVMLVAGRTLLASTREAFAMPNDVMGVVHDKSTWARQGISVQNTVIEPGWRGFLTLELLWSPIMTWLHVAMPEAYGYPSAAPQRFVIRAGTPIAQVVFHQCNQPTQGYDGKYQDQERGPQGPR
jgi:dCTP deaminase